jgi:hypothetical protein
MVVWICGATFVRPNSQFCMNPATSVMRSSTAIWHLSTLPSKAEIQGHGGMKGAAVACACPFRIPLSLRMLPPSPGSFQGSQCDAIAEEVQRAVIKLKLR